MKIVIAPNGFKGNLSAKQVASAIETGIKRALPEAATAIKPMADGGEDTVQVLVDATGGHLITSRVTGPLGGPVDARWGILGDKATAVIEMAAASGLILMPPDKLNPLITTTYGTGELMKAALDNGCRKMIIAIGGSATNDGGAGVAQALGVRLLDAMGKNLPFGGAALAKLARVDTSGLDKRLAECEIQVACDVNNPLCGPKGASAIYGPQKGATPAMVKQLDAALSHYADIIRRDMGIDLSETAGAGSGGGIAFGLMTFMKTKVMPGAELVIQTIGLADDLKEADLVFTGEGRLDSQTASGKTPVAVARVAKQFGVPVVALAGQLLDGYQVVFRNGIDAVFSIAPGPITLAESMAQAEQLTAAAAENAMRLFIAKHK